ncbi:cation:proton antiporter [Marinifilum flexuosum]|uniref:Kef-type K+ transport system membrane component KefB n=1 Tax=Marinifilum flexuosum TaxID=1117708 RepID=A0A419X9S8_9BACT|nr:cation:proton antiporter [Marinifilum flexuosum]RKE04518.1 Kef-type K+ transport system membrane component KefB [Marinifilum flexuosum]
MNLLVILPFFQELLILMVVIWAFSVLLRKVGIPTIMGELVAGILIGPAVLGLIEPNEIIEVLSQLGIFFILLHAGVETNPREFVTALKKSFGIAFIGALFPFLTSMSIALLFGYSLKTSLFVGISLTATAVVVTLKILQDLNLTNTRLARVIVASCIIDDLLSLICFSLILSVAKSESISAFSLMLIAVKSTLFFVVTIVAGYYLYPLFKNTFQHSSGKGFTFLLILGLGFGLLAELIGLHMILGAYLAGLFFREEVANKELVKKVDDRLYAIAYSFLGPIFFISLGFHITFEALTVQGIILMMCLVIGVIIIQIISAGSMAKLAQFSTVESITIGIGMTGRAEMAFILAAIGQKMQILDNNLFSIIVFSTFILNFFATFGLKYCAGVIKRNQDKQFKMQM